MLIFLKHMKICWYDFYKLLQGVKDCKKGNKLENNEVSLLDLGQQDLSWARKREGLDSVVLGDRSPCGRTEAHPYAAHVSIDFCTWAHLSFSLHCHFSLVGLFLIGELWKEFHELDRVHSGCSWLADVEGIDRCHAKF